MIKEFTKEIDLKNENNLDFFEYMVNFEYSSTNFQYGIHLKKTLFFNIPSGKKFLISDFFDLKLNVPNMHSYFNFLIKEGNQKIYNLDKIKGKVLESGNYYLIYIGENGSLPGGRASNVHEANNKINQLKQEFRNTIAKYNSNRNKSNGDKIIGRDYFYYISITGELIDENL